jgi:hypothetical protein
MKGCPTNSIAVIIEHPFVIATGQDIHIQSGAGYVGKCCYSRGVSLAGRYEERETNQGQHN